jgi:hypothetical protein
MEMNINGNNASIKTRHIMEFTLKHDGMNGSIVKVEKPFIVILKPDPWNSEIAQFSTKEEAGKFIIGITQ